MYSNLGAKNFLVNPRTPNKGEERAEGRVGEGEGWRRSREGEMLLLPELRKFVVHAPLMCPLT
jgi:hypothetical protein